MVAVRSLVGVGRRSVRRGQGPDLQRVERIREAASVVEDVGASHAINPHQVGKLLAPGALNRKLTHRPRGAHRAKGRKCTSFTFKGWQNCDGGQGPMCSADGEAT